MHHVVLVEPEIAWNTGNAGRTCLAAGAQLHLVEPLGFEISDARVKRAGLDYWPRVAPRVWPDWDRFESEIPALGAPYFFSSDATVDFWDASFVDPTVLVFGCKSVGLPADIRARYADRLLRLPMQDPELAIRELERCTGELGLAGIEIGSHVNAWNLDAPELFDLFAAFPAPVKGGQGPGRRVKNQQVDGFVHGEKGF